MHCSRKSPSQGPRPTCFHMGRATWLELACLSVECANTFYIFTQIDISIIHDYFLSIKTEIYFGKVVVNALQQGFFHKFKTAKKENNFFKHFINFNKLKKMSSHCSRDTVGARPSFSGVRESVRPSVISCNNLAGKRPNSRLRTKETK